MLTRCPACQTVFRVSAEQLALRQGRVRCGHCLNAFDALHNAVETAPAEPQDKGGEARQAPAPSGSLPENPPAAGEPAQAAGMPAVFRNRGQPVDSAWLRDEEEAAEAPPALETPEEGGTPDPPPVIEDEALPVPTPQREEDIATPTNAAAPLPPGILTRSDPEDGRGENYVRAASIPVPPPALASAARKSDPRRAQAIAVGLLLVALLVQGVFLLRQPLSQAFPGLRAPLLALCQRVGCELPLPREAAEISIEASNLHPEPGGQGDFVLHATLKNRARFPQAYPHVELSLTDAADKPLVRRVFTPAEWAPGTTPGAAFAPDATAVVALPFNAAGVAAVGYRVYAFYP